MSWITDSNSLSLFPFFDLKKKKKPKICLTLLIFKSALFILLPAQERFDVRKIHNSNNKDNKTFNLKLDEY